MRPLRLVLLSACLAALAGCDLLGIETASQLAEKKAAEGKALGGACRHAARSIEQCYELNKRADKAAMFAGWREMNDYMRENKIDAMPPPAATEVAAAEAATDKGKGAKPAPAAKN